MAEPLKNKNIALHAIAQKKSAFTRSFSNYLEDSSINAAFPFTSPT